jgi:hypothetical protein
VDINGVLSFGTACEKRGPSVFKRN